LGVHTDVVAVAVFSPDRHLLLTGGYDKMARLWEVKSGKELRRLIGHRSPVRSAAFSADGKWLITGSGDEDVKGGKRVTSDCTVRLWETARGKELRSFAGHTDWVTYVAFCPDGRHIISAGYLDDPTLRLWDLKTGVEARTIKSPHLTAAGLSPDGKLVLAGGDDNLVHLWEISSGKELFLLRGHQEQVWDVAFSPDGTRALSCGGGDATPGDYSVRLWDIKDGRQLRRIDGHPDIVWKITFSPDGRRALSECKDKIARLWDVETGKEIRYFVTNDESIAGMAFSPDGGRALAVTTDTNTLWQWKLPK
jgi:WD40 repeat protein